MRYSIIVPVYNVERYLKRCVDSILNQTITDFELILIDDGSKDNSGNICDEYEKKDQRIKVIHQENAGVSATRNKGIENAQGKYIVFVDSDDEVSSTYIEDMDKSDADLVILGMKNISLNGEIHHVLQYQSQKQQLTLDVLSEMIDNKSINFIVAKRYRTELIKKENILFNVDIDLGEDTIFGVKYLCLCNDIEYKKSVSYYYYENNSNTLSSFNASYVENLENANKLVMEVLKNKFLEIEYENSWKKRCWSVYYYSIFFVLREWDVSNKDKILLLRRIFKNKEYRKLEKNIEVFMSNDSKLIRKIIKSKNAYFVLLCWKILELKRKLSNEKKR